MIKSVEIQKYANREHVRDSQIEKDYALTWILTGISKNHTLSNGLCFKGGTVLKKFYFDDYRYSEDLDFTLINNEITDEEVKTEFDSVFEYVKEAVNMDMYIEDFSVHETGTINFYVSYIGPLGGNKANKRIKVDISKSELLCFPLKRISMFVRYSDQEECTLYCYALEEIMAEKMRSLLSRTQPRDYYDLWYLSEVENMEMRDYKSEFERKSEYKGLKPYLLEEKIDSKSNMFEKSWESALKNQIDDLPFFEQVHRELGKHFRLLFK